MWPLIKTVAHSRVGQVLCLTNLALVDYCYLFVMKVPVADAAIELSSVGNGGLIAGRWIDFDSSFLLALTLLNILPALLSNVGSALLLALVPEPEVILASWIYAALLLALIVMQWLTVGSFVEKMVRLYRESRTETPHLTRE